MDIYGSKINDTVCAPATIAGTGAITLIRVSGPDAFRAADKVVSLRSGSVSGTPGGSVRFGTVHSSDGSVLDEVLCNVYRAPHSYTGEDSVEIMCHASAYICTEILSLLVGAGCRMAMPGEFTQRAFLAGKIDLTQAEAVADVISASTAAAHRIAMNQLRGGFSDELASLRGRLLEMASLLELELDFSEEDVEFADRNRLIGLLDETVGHISSLAASFKMGNAIKNGVPVAIVGAPNAGKSTLLNALLGEQRAIVSDIAGTTRDTIEECINADGVLLRLVDTAGIRGIGPSSDGSAFSPEGCSREGDCGCRGVGDGACTCDGQGIGEIERIGIERSFASLRKAEMVIVLLDAVTSSDTSTLYDGDKGYLACAEGAFGAQTGDTLFRILRHIDFTCQQAIFALNKCDLAGDAVDNIFVNLNNKIVSLVDVKYVGRDTTKIEPIFVKISAKTGDGVSELLSTLAGSVKERMNAAGTDSVTVTNARHWEALLSARNLLLQVRSGLTSDSPTDLVAEDLRSAISTLGSITGSITTTDVLENIFSKFCIGK